MTTTIAYKTKDGKSGITLVATVSESNAAGKWTAYVDGVRSVCDCMGCYDWDAIERAAQNPDAAHVKAGLVAHVGRVGITSSRLDDMRAAIEPMIAQTAARSDVALRILVTEHESLTKEVGYAVEAYGEAHERFIERLSANGVAVDTHIPALKAEMERAHEHIASFEAANPDAMAEIARQRHESVARFISAGN